VLARLGGRAAVLSFILTRRSAPGFAATTLERKEPMSPRNIVLAPRFLLPAARPGPCWPLLPALFRARGAKAT
jgi:hypothetical protein